MSARVQHLKRVLSAPQLRRREQAREKHRGSSKVCSKPKKNPCSPKNLQRLTRTDHCDYNMWYLGERGGIKHIHTQTGWEKWLSYFLKRSAFSCNERVPAHNHRDVCVHERRTRNSFTVYLLCVVNGSAWGSRCTSIVHYDWLNWHSHSLTLSHTHTRTHARTHAHTHTHTHTCWFLWFTGTLHRRNGFYTVQAVCAIALHLPYT